MPLNPWQPGAYQLVALTVLEDPSGTASAVPSSRSAAGRVPVPERVTRLFTIR